MIVLAHDRFQWLVHCAACDYCLYSKILTLLNICQMTSSCSNCTEIYRTVYSAWNCLFWTLFSFNFNIPNNGLNHINIYIIYNEFCYQVANTTSLYGSHNEEFIYTLGGLKYANTLYDVRVYLRSALALGEDKWSAPTINTFRTKPTCEYTDNLSFVVIYVSCFYTYVMNFHGCCYNVEWSRSVWNIKRSFGMVLVMPLFFCALFWLLAVCYTCHFFSVCTFWITAKFN